MQQLSLYLALRRLSRRITRRAERSVVGSVARVTVRSLGSRVLFIGMLPLQPLALQSAPAASSQPLTGAPAADKVGIPAVMTARQQSRCPASDPSGASMDNLRHLTPIRVVPVIRCWTAVAVTQGFVDAGHFE